MRTTMPRPSAGRDPGSRRLPIPAWSLIGLAMLGPAAFTGPQGALAAGRPLRAQGRVLDETGAGLGGWPVLLLATQRYITLNRFTSGGDVAVAGRTTTDAQGYFSFDLEKSRGYHYWFLRFTDPTHFDPVVWDAPGDVEITKDVKRRRAAMVEVRLRHHASWREVEKRIALSGGESTPRGRILRALGLPEKEAGDPAAGSEEWWYFTKGVLYVFRGADSPELHRFEPVPPPPTALASRNP